MTTFTTKTVTIKTRSTAPFALVKGEYLMGYAHSRGPLVIARARRIGATIVPIVDGKATYEIAVPA